jgi:16S rRNA (cytosine967-C5)-methyltransferase
VNKKPQPAHNTARAAAYTLLQAALRSRIPVDDGFDEVVEHLEPRDRAFTRLLVATTLRRLGQIDAVLAKFVERTAPAPAEDALRLGAAQLLFMDTPIHAAVDTSVDLVKRRGQDRLTGLVNAVLRKVGAQGRELVAAQDAALLNTPDWLMARWQAAYGDQARAIAEAHLTEAPLDLTTKSPEGNLGGERLPTGTVRLKDAGPIAEIEGFGAGDWWVQDAAAALPAKLLLHALNEKSGGKTVIDVCAAPGGKTAQLIAAGCDVTAVDLSKPRMKVLKENLARLSLTAATVTSDAKTWRPKQPADGVLLDAPCSATGTIRRHPDLPYVKREADFARFPEIQRQLLEAASAMSGLVVYSVCALEPAEGEDVVEAFLAAHPDWQRKPISPDAVGGEAQFITAKGDLRTLPSMWADKGGLDGFYAAVLEKRS